MTDTDPPRPAHDMAAVIQALRAMDGTADPGAVLDWVRAHGAAKPGDGVGSSSRGRFVRKVLFARMMLARAGLVEKREAGRWGLTPAGLNLDLTPQSADRLLRALNGARNGPLDAERTYRAIVDAARDRQFLSYGDLARASGVPWNRARRPLPVLLGRLTQLAHVRGWPMLTAIVVSREGQESGVLTQTSLQGFAAVVRSLGLDPGDDLKGFVRSEQQRVFDWAHTAPGRLGLGDRRGGRRGDPRVEADLAFALPAEVSSAVMEAAVAAPSPGRSGGPRYWFAGATWGREDQTDRFLAQGVWRNGDPDQFRDQVRAMEPGDRIALKTAFTGTVPLPFDVGAADVSVMRITATGVVTANLGDGVTVRVAWDPPGPPRDWYFYTYEKPLQRADPQIEQARRLIEFTFADTDQDYGWWLQQPYFARKYGRRSLGGTDGAQASPAGAAAYATVDVVADGCFLAVGALDDIVARLRARKNLILQGPPGTGKTWLARRLAYVLLGARDRAAVDLRLRVVQFHPSLAYEDFVRGWRPVNGQLHLADGVLLQAIDAALSEPDRPFVLVIEEINRGNPAQILGEMLTLLEDSKRNPAEALELAYPRDVPGGERVYVPDNLYVIGTMNVADRSLALVDLALRRRFAFVSLEPRLGPAWRDWSHRIGGLQPVMAELIETRLTALNRMIADDPGLGGQFRVGHSYVTPTGPVGGDGGGAWFRSVVQTEILPLLDEYWHDQPDKVAAARRDLLRDLP